MAHTTPRKQIKCARNLQRSILSPLAAVFPSPLSCLRPAVLDRSRLRRFILPLYPVPCTSFSTYCCTFWHIAGRGASELTYCTGPRHIYIYDTISELGGTRAPLALSPSTIDAAKLPPDGGQENLPVTVGNVDAYAADRLLLYRPRAYQNKVKSATARTVSPGCSLSRKQVLPTI